MRTLSFRDYINTRRPSFTGNGRFIERAKRDEEFLNAQSWHDLEAYLVSRNALPQRDHARQVWLNYMDARKRKTGS
jgi:hypothetical protein